MKIYFVDFFPKPAYGKKHCPDISVRVVANDREHLATIAGREFELEHPELDARQFLTELISPIHC
jgi:hypothetical protein